MRNILAVIPFFFSAMVTGQQPSLTCLSDVGVYARNGGRLFVKSIPKSTAITKTTELSAFTTYVANSATVRVTPAISKKTATFVFRETAYVNSPSFPNSPSGAGTATKSPNQPHSWLLKVPPNTAGNVLLVTIKSTLNRWQSGVIQLAQLDIGNDNKLEVNLDLTKASVATTFTLGTQAVDIRIVTHGDYTINYPGGYDFTVGLTLNPDVPLKISSYGPMCGMKLGMSGVVTGVGHTVSLKIEGGFAARGGILMLGLRPVVTPFPGTPCLMLVNPLVTLPFSDSNGTSILELQAPGRIDGVVYLQAVSAHSGFGYTSFRMSNGIAVDGQ